MPKPTKSSPALPGSNLQSTYANRFHVTIHGATVRIAFGESIMGVDHYSTALTMLTNNAVELAEVILKLVREASQPDQPRH